MEPIIDCQIIKDVVNNPNLLIVQDIDGVCIPLVKNPLEREIELEYLLAAEILQDNFFVLTNGEHEGYRGLNKVVDRATNQKNLTPGSLYLAGLAAGGIEYQDRMGNINALGINDFEMEFLSKVSIAMKEKLSHLILKFFPDYRQDKVNTLLDLSVLDTIYSPTINLHAIIQCCKKNTLLIQQFQKEVYSLMDEILTESEKLGMTNSFYLHIAPNIGKENEKEILKLATSSDIGTTDIQFMIKGSVKEAGLLVLINKQIEYVYGVSPLGKSINVRDLTSTNEELISISKRIPKELMPTIIGVGDTVTSDYCPKTNCFRRGGSDRGFLQLVQDLGKLFGTNNKVLIVDSSHGEVARPTLLNGIYEGISDKNDPLHFDMTFPNGTEEYIQWFISLSSFHKSAKNKLADK